MGVRLTADKPGQISVKVSLSRAQSVLSQTAAVSKNAGGLHSVSLSANSGQTSGAITFWSEARIGHSGGTCQIYATSSRSNALTRVFKERLLPTAKLFQSPGLTLSTSTSMLRRPIDILIRHPRKQL
jgi:hypothetical protein